ncbi:MAG TPA: BrxA family protein [Thermoguttaceae bacterium]|nr:BrxA family protein [Thermoguttaceae bacterium]
MKSTGTSLAGSVRGKRAKPESRRRTRAPKATPSPPAARYTSRIIKAGALLADTKTLLSQWDTAASVKANLARVRQENLFGKASRSRVEDILAIFRQRYLSDEEVAKALVVFVKNRLPTASLDRILFFHSARNDRLLSDAVTELLLPLKARGITDVDALEVRKVIAKWVAEGKTTAKWNDATILRVTQGLLSALRDFGVLQGAVNKRIAPAYLPIEAFAYIAFYLRRHQPSAAKLLELPDWNLFFLPPAGVERFLIEAHQHNLLEYHAAGTVTRLTFPASTLEEYANVIA